MYSDMKVRLLKIFILAILTFCSQSLYSQIGFQGKWIGLKADLVSALHPGGIGAHLEIIPTRKFSFSLGYQYVAQNADIFNVENPNLSPTEIRGSIYWIGIRTYGSKAIPAPVGRYLMLNVGYGSYSAEGNTEVYYDADKRDYRKVLAQFKVQKIGFFQIEFGGGYQWIIKRRFLVDASIAFAFQDEYSSSTYSYDNIDSQYNSIVSDVGRYIYKNATPRITLTRDVYFQPKIMVGVLLF